MSVFSWLRAALLAGGAMVSAIAASGAEARTQTVAYRSPYEAGTIVISMKERKLYLLIGDNRAIEYPVAVAKPGKEWLGPAHIQAKYAKPDWTPPAVVKRDHPELPNLIPGGSPRNPMGVAAMTLDRSEIAIHGTTEKMRASIGSRASYGCIRMLNEDVADLYNRVDVGAEVIMQP